jgi:hypothetical protein
MPDEQRVDWAQNQWQGDCRDDDPTHWFIADGELPRRRLCVELADFRGIIQRDTQLERGQLCGTLKVTILVRK